MTAKCKKCKYFKAFFEKKLNYDGECRVAAPKHFDFAEPFGSWPYVRESGFCGCYEKKSTYPPLRHDAEKE